ncbi:MAG: glycosyltransferase family 4 protein [Chloroflexota bacterium]|nr:glycosyltransferase family 4 protein [Chloroflexota bacterium]
MRVLLIHQAFASPREAGGTRHHELARHLVRQGHQVAVVTGTVSYLTGQTLPSAQRRWLTCEREDGMEIVRIRTYAAHHRSFFTRTLSFLGFMVSSFVGAARVGKVDVVWGTSPPLFQALPAFVLARLRRVPFVFEVRDLWPDFAVQVGVLRNPLLIWGARWIERFLYRHADRLMVNSPGFIPHLRRCGVPEDKIDLVTNGVDVGAFDPQGRGEAVRQELGLDDQFVAVYAGAHGLAHDLGTALRAALRLQGYREIVFLLVGDGKEKVQLVQHARDLGLDNVRFIPAQSKARMPEVLAAADIGIAILQDMPMFGTTYPNKVFDYMAAGRPTVLAIDGVIRTVIEAAGGGLFVPPGDEQALADAVLSLYRDPALRQRQGAAARAYVLAHFDRGRQARKLEALLLRLTGAGRPGAIAPPIPAA